VLVLGLGLGLGLGLSWREIFLAMSAASRVDDEDGFAVELRTFGARRKVDVSCDVYVCLIGKVGNPWWVKGYEGKSALDGEIFGALFDASKNEGVEDAYEAFVAQVGRLVKLFRKAFPGADTCRVGVCCNSGRHRSVAFAVRFCKESSAWAATCTHRDVSFTVQDAPKSVKKSTRWFSRFCQPCNRTITTCDDWNSHIMGKSHSKRASKSKRKAPSRGKVSAIEIEMQRKRDGGWLIPQRAFLEAFC